MEEFIFEYGLFLAKTLTILAGIALLIAMVAGLSSGKEDKEHLEIKKINDKYRQFASALNAELLNKKQWKSYQKKTKQLDKQSSGEHARKRIFVLDFDGDIKASATGALAEEITAVLTVATPADEVFVRVYSAGGLVHAYGLAASQLERVKKAHIPLIVAVDKVAASGGYMMACVANRVVAAPFSIVGSIGVVGQVPNLHRLLKKHDIDYELHTAGKFKRTLTVFGENTDAARDKFREDLEETHKLFKDFIQQHRPQVDLEVAATGEYWHGIQAEKLKLIDEVTTSDDYLLQASQHADLYQVRYTVKEGLASRIQGFFGKLTAQTRVDSPFPFQQ